MGGIPSMGHHKRLVSDCFKRAWSGSISAANSWGPIVGGIALAVVLRYTGLRMSLLDGWLGVAEVAGMGLGAAWVLIFIVRLIAAPDCDC